MRFIKTYEKFDEIDLLQKGFEKYLPKIISIIKNIEGETITREFDLSADNIMRHANMTQITYIARRKIFGHPDEMSIDLYYYRNGGLKLTFDIIYGDYISSEFTCKPPNTVKVVQYTSRHSKFDPSNTIFAFSDDSIQSLCDFINKIDGFNVNPQDFKFLDKQDNFSQSD